MSAPDAPCASHISPPSPSPSLSSLFSDPSPSPSPSPSAAPAPCQVASTFVSPILAPEEEVNTAGEMLDYYEEQNGVHLSHAVADGEWEEHPDAIHTAQDAVPLSSNAEAQLTIPAVQIGEEDNGGELGNLADLEAEMLAFYDMQESVPLGDADAQLPAPAMETGEKDNGGEEGNMADLEAEMLAFYDTQESVPLGDAGAQLPAPTMETGEKDNGVEEGNMADLEAEMLAVFEEEDEEEGGVALHHGPNLSPATTSPDQAHDLGDSPVRGSTSSLHTSLSPGAEDADSDLGSELSPQEWAVLNGDAPPPPPPPSSPKARGRKKSKARTTGGKKKKGKGKSQVDERKNVIAKIRKETLHAQKATSLDHAVEHIQSKVAGKTREIFIDNNLPDIVMHGQTEAEDVMATGDASGLPKVYHEHWRGGPNYRLLTKHMDLQNDVKLNEVYTSLRLNIGRGKDLYDKIRALLGNPGCSLRVDGDLTEDHKLLVAERAHQLLAVVGWGNEHFQRPTLTGKEGKDQLLGQMTWGNASTEIFLGFCKLLYKAAKSHEARRKGTNRRTFNAEPAVAGPSEPQQVLLAEPPAPAPVAPVAMAIPTITAPGPSAAPSGPSHARSQATKRPHVVLDLTSDVEDHDIPPSRPPKRVRTSAQQTRRPQHMQRPQNVQRPQNMHWPQNVQWPHQFVPVVTQAMPQSPHTLGPQQMARSQQPLQIQNMQQPLQFFPAATPSIPQSPHTLELHQVTGTQRQISAQVEAYQRLIAQRNQALPQHQFPQHVQPQAHQQQQQLLSHPGQQNHQVQSQTQIPQPPQMWPQYQATPPPWAHLQSRHNDPRFC